MDHLIKTDADTLKQLIEESNVLREHVNYVSEKELRNLILRLATRVERLAYENLILDDQRKILKMKYGRALKRDYDTNVKPFSHNG